MAQKTWTQMDDLTPWPLTAAWLADRWSRDYAGYWNRILFARDAAQTTEAEQALGANLYRDWLTAVAEFWLIPLKACSEAHEAIAGRGDGNPEGRTRPEPGQS